MSHYGKVDKANNAIRQGVKLLCWQAHVASSVMSGSSKRYKSYSWWLKGVNENLQVQSKFDRLTEELLERKENLYNNVMIK